MLEPIYYPTFIDDVIFVLGVHQRVPDSIPILEMNLYSHYITNILETFTEPLDVGENYIPVVAAAPVVVFVVVVVSPMSL